MRYGWTYDHVDWLVARTAICELQWKSISFVAQYAVPIPTAPGVYMFLLRTSNLLFETQPWREMQAPMYIGQTNNLRRRFKEHVENRSLVHKHLEKFPHVKFCYALAEQERLNEIESALVKVFGPSINQIQPPTLRAKLLDPIKI